MIKSVKSNGIGNLPVKSVYSPARTVLHHGKINGHGEPAAAVAEKKHFNNRILSSLKDADAARLDSWLELTALTASSDLTSLEERREFVYFPETAVVSHLHTSADGNTIETALTGRDGIFGLAGLLGSSAPPFFSTAQITVNGSAWRVKTDVLQREMSANASLQKSIYKAVNNRLLQLSQRAVCNAFHLAENRLCKWLLQLHDQTGREVLPLTHDQIARSLGIQRPSITHAAQNLREKKLIGYVRGRIRLLDIAKLESNACECYGTLKSLIH